HVRKDRLAQLGLAPGPWLAELKRHLLADESEAPVALPNGARQRAGHLRDRLIDVTAGSKVAYATDFADTPDNAQALSLLARGADVLVCEATFLQADAARARATQHLTTRACVRMGLAAEVRQLLPFHFSRRYGPNPDVVHDELLEACRGTALEGRVLRLD
ncbi:MAG: MBL fold metallo-hydrolase, partial [Pseudomonadales bacterium]